MNTDPSRYLDDLQPGQRVLVKKGTFAGLRGVVTALERWQLPAVVRVELRIHGRQVPVQFANPTVDELERV